MASGNSKFLSILIFDYLVALKRSEFVTTVTELMAIAQAATIGLRKPESPIKKYM